MAEGSVSMPERIRNEEAEPVETPAKKKTKGPPPKWDEFLKERHQGGKERVSNPNPETAKSFPRVQFLTALRHKPFLQKVMKEYSEWINKGKAPPESKTPESKTPESKPKLPKKLVLPKKKKTWSIPKPNFITPDTASKLWEDRDKKLSEFKQGVKSYTGSAYRDINRALRQNQDPGYYKKYIDELDKAMQKSKAKEAFSVHRTVTMDHPLYKAVQEGTLKPGDSIIDKGFVSTTTDQHLNFNSGLKLLIHVPKGYPSIWVESPPEPSYTLNPGESEIILDRDTEMVVDRVIKSTVVLMVQPKKDKSK